MHRCLHSPPRHADKCTHTCMSTHKLALPPNTYFNKTYFPASVRDQVDNLLVTYFKLSHANALNTSINISDKTRKLRIILCISYINDIQFIL